MSANSSGHSSFTLIHGTPPPTTFPQEAEIANEQQLMEKYERLYESLLEFKRLFSQCQDNFTSGHNAKRQQLDTVSNVTNNNITAQRYYAGMDSYLQRKRDSSQEKFNRMSEEIDNKLQRYKSLIESCESRITTLQHQLDSARDSAAQQNTTIVTV